jgi:D-lyxose ketol-isomerase
MPFNPNDRHLRKQCLELIDRSGVLLSSIERERLVLTDFGLDNFEREGVGLVDLLRTPTVRTGVLVLLPHQTLPEHRHPLCEHSPGKEETIRCLFGEFRVYRVGQDTMERGSVPRDKHDCYTVRHEIILSPPEQTTLARAEAHWFQAGPEGAVGMTFQNTVDESYNDFTDPGVTSACGVSLRSARR